MGAHIILEEYPGLRLAAGKHTRQLNSPLRVGGRLDAASHAGPLAGDVAYRCVEQAPDFVKARRAYLTLESAINRLDVHGLDVCRDNGCVRLEALAFSGFALKTRRLAWQGSFALT